MMGGWIHDLLPNDVAEAALSGASKAIDTGDIQALDLSIELPSGQRDYEARLTERRRRGYRCRS